MQLCTKNYCIEVSAFACTVNETHGGFAFNIQLVHVHAVKPQYCTMELWGFRKIVKVLDCEKMKTKEKGEKYKNNGYRVK